jgi:hypothetical protein
MLRDRGKAGKGQLWSDAELVDYLNEGLSVMQGLRPDAFTTIETITLTPGVRQELPEGMDRLVELLDNVTSEDDASISNGAISEATDNYKNALRRYDCNKQTGECAPQAEIDGYLVRSFSVSPSDPTSFTVEPPVPAGASPTVTARVVGAAPCHDASDGTCIGVAGKHAAALVDWMLFRAWSADIESEFAFRSAAAANQRFYAIVGLQRLNEARYASGFWLGAEGDGDPQTDARNTP